ncbi:MAG: class I SAM-dependent methyltransferase [Janthinobacterium lividum]
MTPTWPAGERAALPCPVCGGGGPHPVLLHAPAGGRTHTLLRCAGCTACFYRDRDIPDYGTTAGSELFRQVYLEQNAGIHHMTSVLFRLDDPGLDTARLDSLLDVGCGFGYPVDLAAKVLGWRAVGVDPADNAAAGARLLRADLRQEYLTAASELGEPFSVVMGSEVIEHIPDPYPFTALLRRWLKPGGILVFTTPDAAGIHPGQDPATLFCMLSAGGHMVLYSAEAMEVMLRRAGFAHVRTECAGTTLTAYASDRPLRFRADAPARHLAGYRAYLQHLTDTAEPGTPLWNGAAGRLFELDAHGAPLEDALGLWARIAAAWRDRFGFDLVRHRLPAPLPESAFATDPMLLLEAHVAAQPVNLGAVLAARAALERRMPGHTPESLLSLTRPAYITSVQTRRVLERCGLIDLALRDSAANARLMMLDALVELAPELELELLAAVAAPSGDPAAQVDVPPGRIIARMAGPFTRAVAEGRMGEAARLAPFLTDLDAIVAAPHGSPVALLLLLFRLGLLRLHLQDRTGARAAFRRMAEQAAGWNSRPEWTEQAGPLLRIAEEQIAVVDSLAGVRTPRKRRA